MQLHGTYLPGVRKVLESIPQQHKSENKPNIQQIQSCTVYLERKFRYLAAVVQFLKKSSSQGLRD